MKHILTAIIAVVCIVAGGVGGHFLKSSGASAEAATAPAETGHGTKDDHAKDDHGQKDDKGKAKDDKHAKAGAQGKGGGAPGAIAYYKFPREFVVPLIENGRVSSLVILNINLEIDESASAQMFLIEPAVRDNIMTTLISLANDGKTFQTLSDIESYESMRALVLMNLRKAVPNGVRNVLILDMARQDI